MGPCGLRAGAGGAWSLWCPVSPTAPMGARGALQLWSQHRAKGACRGQPAPSWQAQGGQSPAVSLNAPLCARQRGGRAWLSLGLGTLVGWGVSGQDLGGPPCGDPASSPQTQKAILWLAHGWAGGETPLGHLCKCCQGFVVAKCTPNQRDTAPDPRHRSLPQFPTARQDGRGAAWCPQPGVGWEGTTEQGEPLPPPWAASLGSSLSSQGGTQVAWQRCHLAVTAS